MKNTEENTFNDLWVHMKEIHGLQLFETELNDIKRIADRINNPNKIDWRCLIIGFLAGIAFFVAASIAIITIFN